MPEDIFRDRAERRVSERGGRLIASTISALRLPAGVKLFAVALDDEPPVDDEVHTADSGHGYGGRGPDGHSPYQGFGFV